MADETETQDEPPRRRGRETKAEREEREQKDKRTGKTPPSPPRVTPSRGTLHAPLQEFFGMLALPFTMAGDYQCAFIITVRTPPFAEALANLAEKNPGLKRALQRLMEGGDYGQVIYTGLAVAIPIGFHHGLEKLGFVNPFALNPDELGDYHQFVQSVTGAPAPTANGTPDPGSAVPAVPTPLPDE